MLKIGTAGIPSSTKKSGTAEGIKRIKEIGLDAMEIEFVRGVYMTPEQAKQIKIVAEKNNISLTVHAPYYINLNSPEPEKINASMARIVRSAKIGAIAGAQSVTFHPAYYMKKPAKEVYQLVKESLIKIQQELKRTKTNIIISPEITGKHSAFGNLDELLQLAKELKIGICIDFAHLHARTNGKLNSKKDFDEIFLKVKNVLGSKALKNMHMHVSGINYTEKGERNHLMLQNSDFKIKSFVESLKHFNVEGILICESPNPEEDALYIKNLIASVY
jgi:deoxyribonuclease IV